MVHLYLILTIIFWAAGQTLLRAGLSRSSPVDGFIACGIAGFAAGVPCWLIMRPHPAFVPVCDPIYPYIAISLWAALSYLTYYYAIASGELAAASALYGTCPVWTAIFAVTMLGEKLSMNQTVAIAVVVAGVMLLSYESARQGEASVPASDRITGGRWWMMVFIAVTSAAITGVADAVTKVVAIDQSPATHLLYYWSGQIVMGLLIKAALERSNFSIRPVFDRYLLGGMFVMNLGGVCFIVSMTLGQVSVIEAFTSSYMALVALASWRFFGERFTPLKTASIIAIAAGVVMLARG